MRWLAAVISAAGGSVQSGSRAEYAEYAQLSEAEYAQLGEAE